VTIGLPVYNGENFLEQALEGLLSQTFTDFELIISDNASTDRTQEICQAYALDTRIRYVRQPTNIGAGPNHNMLVAGMNDADMVFAVERLVEAGGGMVAVADGEVLALVSLPIAGLICDRPVAELATETLALSEAYRELGSPIEDPAMIFSFLSLGVIPALRLTNRGLVDGVAFELVSPLV